ncbi:MAG: hypothetical protein JM58_00315 [Peptococcaceae bacterium BICA1-8]|nr:MAG: hypothetical protein JM58_00315 [Peptococcaceae bacterium BICA1-8]
MLSEQEIINNAMKELLAYEERMACKYAELNQDITEPKLQQMLRENEMAARNNYGTLSQKMTNLGIVK